MKFLNETGLVYFLNKLKSLFVTKTDFDKIYNTDGIINAKQIIHKTNNDDSKNYDLTLGDRETFEDSNADKGSYICISGQTNPDETYVKEGNIYINAYNKSNISASPSIYLNATSNIHLSAQYDIDLSGRPMYSNINISSGIMLSPLTDTTIESQLFVKNYGNNLSFTDNAFDITYANSDSYKAIHYEPKGTNGNASEKLQFIVDSNNTATVDIRPTQIKCWTDTFSIKKDKEIKFKTSSTNSCRLTEGEGFKVFGNLYAMPDHATDLEGFIGGSNINYLSDNSVQKILSWLIYHTKLIYTLTNNKLSNELDTH